MDTTQNEKIVKIAGLLALFAIVFFAVLSTNLAEASAGDPSEVAGSSGPSCRYGVASFNEADNPYITQLHVGWTVNFAVTFNRTWPSGVDYVPIIRLKQDRDPVTGARLPTYTVTTQPLNDNPGGLGPLISANPGRMWLVGNEVDRVFWQDDIMPDIYAEAYHEIYHFIKDRDPSARVAISGLVEVTPGRLQYLDIVWESYLEKYGQPIPVDVWNMHIYILPEKKADGTASSAAIALGTDPALAILESGNNPALCSQGNVYCYAEHDDPNIFLAQVRAMRQWMKNHGLQNKPLILSEFSLLYPYDGKTPCFLMDEFGSCFTPTRVSNFLRNAVGILESETDVALGYPQDNYRLVQQWLWFAMYDGTDHTPNALVNINTSTGDPTGLSTIGIAFRDEAAASTFDVNLIPSSVSNTAVSNSTSVLISAEVRNNGGVLAESPFTVSFYSNEALTSLIGEVVVPAGLSGCATDGQTVSVTWNGLVPDQVNEFWVKIDSGGAVVESNEIDNVATGMVIVDPDQVFLPVISR